MPITRTPIIDDSGSGTDGTVIDNAWKQQFYDQIDAMSAAAGPWVDIPHNAAMYTAQGADWYVAANNQANLGFMQAGKMVTVAFAIVGTSAVSVATPKLFITVPMAAASRQILVPFSYTIVSTSGTGMLNINPGTNKLELFRDLAGTPFPAGPTGVDLYLYGLLTFPTA